MFVYVIVVVGGAASLLLLLMLLLFLIVHVAVLARCSLYALMVRSVVIGIVLLLCCCWFPAVRVLSRDYCCLPIALRFLCVFQVHGSLSPAAHFLLPVSRFLDPVSVVSCLLDS